MNREDILKYDVSLWVEFNKEIELRKLVDISRKTLNYGVTGVPEQDAGTALERYIAEKSLNDMIKLGYINKITFERT